MITTFDWPETWTLTIKQLEAEIVLNEDEITDLLNQMLDGFCPLCLTEIPAESQLCCQCLREVYDYHLSHDACLA